MRIAQVAPLFERVPPRLYGGTERIVSYLTEELVRQGQDVTLFASGDSITAAELVCPCDTALRLNPAVADPIPYHVMLIEQVMERSHEFDVIHFHVDLLHLPFARRIGSRAVTTLHGRLDLPDLPAFYGMFGSSPLVSCSDNQRHPLASVNWVGTVHHGLPINLLRPVASGDGGYLAFLGRISPEKGPDRAIEIASRLGMPLKIAAKVDKADRAFWESSIKPLVDSNPNVEFIGEVNEVQKMDFLSRARAVLFPIEWPEPFGLVMIEAMACGTPVIAYRWGSVPEVIEDGVSGFIVEGIDEAVEAVRCIDEIDRAAVRRAFERRFTAEHMTNGYLQIYRELIDDYRPPARLQAMPARDTHIQPIQQSA
jgi:glycosyltransferase involved in cell wall biosynthesis